MHFVRTEDLKTGMRLARPVYNKKSILLFDRNSLLSVQAIESIRNFGLIGVYVLEPAEPLPPMTQEDLEFERFQIKAVGVIEEEQERIRKTRKQSRTQAIADMVIRNYGHLDEKINFYQNLRSLEDYVSRHSLNVAILCAMITHVMNLRREEQYHTVCAAILHDMGKLRKKDAVYYGAPYSGGTGMHFVRTEDLKTGMRLARPVYNKKSILLFDRNSLLSVQAIESIRNFGLIGVYVLEPAEPLPPMTQEDLEFERFQIKAVGVIEEEQERIRKTRKQSRTQAIADMVIRNYGHLDEKINFYQNLRSLEDYVSRHSLNVAILCAMITHVMNLRREEQYHTVCAAILHDMGKLRKKDAVYYGAPYSGEDMLRNCETQEEAYGMIEEAFATDGMNIRRICQQAARKQLDLFPADGEKSRYKMLAGANVLLVANRYDEITAMTLQGTAQSEVKAIQEFTEHPEVYDPETVRALIRSINILPPGASVELSTGEKALVLNENEENVLRPTLVSFRDNSILNLALPENEDIHIVDVMKTMDNRYIFKK